MQSRNLKSDLRRRFPRKHPLFAGIVVSKDVKMISKSVRPYREPAGGWGVLKALSEALLVIAWEATSKRYTRCRTAIAASSDSATWYSSANSN